MELHELQSHLSIKNSPRKIHDSTHIPPGVIRIPEESIKEYLSDLGADKLQVYKIRLPHQKAHQKTPVKQCRGTPQNGRKSVQHIPDKGYAG